MRAMSLAALILICANAVPAQEAVPATAPEWAVQYTEGLAAWRDIIYFWLDRQHHDGTFGFGWGEDCEMMVGWPGVMMAADDRRIEEAIERLCENRWFNPNIQRGYLATAADPEHGPEPISYTTPVLAYQKFGSPMIVERLMVTAQNVDDWTAITPKGDRHMRSSWFGSQQRYDWEFYDEDSPMCARAWIPMTHLLLYNRDPYLMKYYTEWCAAWARHAMDPDTCRALGKPLGFLPLSVAFPTGEPGGYTGNWWGSSSHDFSRLWYQTRLHGMLVVSYQLTGEDRYIAPLREMLRFVAAYAKPRVAEDQPLPPDRLPADLRFPTGWREGTVSTEWARDLGRGHFLNWYYYATGDTQFDEAFGRLLGEPIERGPFAKIDRRIVEDGRRRAKNYRDTYFDKVVPELQFKGSLANYAAAFWQKHYGTMTFGNRCFRDGGRLANSVNWPWVDFPPPSVVWRNTGYETAIFVLADEPVRFRAALCNVADGSRTVGAQLLTLAEGPYRLRLGPDADEDGTLDAVAEERDVAIRRGTVVPVALPSRMTMLLELARDPAAGPAPAWEPRPDLALDAWDVTADWGNKPKDSGIVSVRVHNIGTCAAEGFVVHTTVHHGDGKQLRHTATVAELPPPHKLQPSHQDVSFTIQIPHSEVRAIHVEVDPEDRIAEIYEGNNTVDVPAAKVQPTRREKQTLQVEPAHKPSLADVTRKDLAEYIVPRRAGLVLDGTVEAGEWQGVPVFDFLPHAEDKPLAKGTQMRLAYDDNALYLAFVCEEPHMDRLDAELAHGDIHDIYYNDGFELFLDPGAEVWRYWQLVFDTVPRQFQTKTRNEYAKKAEWEVRIAKGTDSWSAEVRLPFASFERAAPAPSERWRMNAMRFTTTVPDPKSPDGRANERSHFSPLGALHGHHTPELFGDIYFESRPTGD